MLALAKQFRRSLSCSGLEHLVADVVEIRFRQDDGLVLATACRGRRRRWLGGRGRPSGRLILIHGGVCPFPFPRLSFSAQESKW